MIIPHQQLPAETLQALLEEYASRDGTDYGETEVALTIKVQQLHEQLKRGEICLVFEAATESAHLVPRHELRSLGLEE